MRPGKKALFHETCVSLLLGATEAQIVERLECHVEDVRKITRNLEKQAGLPVHELALLAKACGLTSRAQLRCLVVNELRQGKKWFQQAPDKVA